MGYLPRKKRTKKKWPVTILFDDREKNPWLLSPRLFKMKRTRLETGDYTIEGFEKSVAIEKKAGITEIIQNISGADRERFRKTLRRLSKYEHKYLVIDSVIDDIDLALKKLPKKSRITKASVCYWLVSISVEYSIPIIFLGSKRRTRDILLENLFLRIIDSL